MRNRSAVAMAAALLVALLGSAAADTIITRDGSSYSGQYLGARQGTIGFTDSSGVGYTFPMRDVQSLVFTGTNDTVTLRNGKVYSGKFGGPDPLAFKDKLGILYEFPRRDVESLVLSAAEAAQASTPPPDAKVIPTGTEISIRIEENIDSGSASAGQRFAAEVVDAVDDLSGGVAIPAHSKAKLLIVSESGGGAGSPYLYLDLDSVNIKGVWHRVFTSELKESSNQGFGKNKRTAEFLGGGGGGGGGGGVSRATVHARQAGEGGGGDGVAVPAGAAAGAASAVDQRMATADVVIIGGGIVGSSIAYHLTAAGCRNVLVIERETQQGKGSTGKSMGGVRAQFSTPVNIRMSLYAIPFYASFEERLGHPAGYRPQGYLFCATNEKHL